jgi:translation initiation factor 6
MNGVYKTYYIFWIALGFTTSFINEPGFLCHMPFMTNFNGNPNIGLFGYARDEYCLLGRDIQGKIAKKIEKTLNVKVHKVSIAGTSLIGVFCAGNSKCLLIPSIVFDDEMKKLERLKINYEVIETRFTALGNNVLANDKGCLVNPELEDGAIKQIEKALGVKAKRTTIAGLNTLGSLAILNKNGCLTHYGINKKEAEKIRKLLKAKTFPSSINRGNPYVKSGLILNNFDYIVGDQSTGVEVSEMENALGFVR